MKNLKILLPVAFALPAQFLWGQAPIYDSSQPRQQPRGEYGYGFESRKSQGADAGSAVQRDATQPETIPRERNLQLEMYQQVKNMQQEIMELRGIVEEQGHELRTLKQQSLDRYIELDRRIAGGSSNGGQGAASDTAKPRPVVGGGVPSEEIDAYRKAYELVKAKQFDQAIVGFDRFLQDFPDGTYAPNALYWKGELQLVNSPRDLKAAEQAFASLLKDYPDHSKVPDAMYKLGKVYFLSGEKAKSRKVLDELIAKHGSSSRSAVKFARQFLQDNF